MSPKDRGAKRCVQEGVRTEIMSIADSVEKLSMKANAVVCLAAAESSSCLAAINVFLNIKELRETTIRNKE
tara:strand:- start:636 stop:848 length:213 start_codon:yes stop_codon:yes gene_type:complete